MQKVLRTPTRRTFTSLILGALSTPVWVPTSIGQTAPKTGSWPTQPVRIITPSAPGSSTDIAARRYADRLAELWKQPVVVEAKTGAQGAIAVKSVLERADDGHTLLFAPTGIVTITPLLSRTPAFDPTALAPLSLAAIDHLTVAASAQTGARDLKQFVEAAKRQPGKFNVAAGPGGPTLALLNFIHRHKLDVKQVPYRSPPDAISDLVSGRIQLLVGPLAPVLALARDEKVTLLAVTNPARSPVASAVPTAAEQGFDELTFEGSLGLFGPVSMAKSNRAKVAQTMLAVSREEQLATAFGRVGLVPKAESGDALLSRLDRQVRHWRKVIEVTGFKLPG